MKTLSVILSVILVLTSSLQAGPIQDAAHLVSIEDLRTEISVRNAERAGYIREVQTLLRHPAVQKLGHLFPLEKIEAAILALDDAALARLAHESARMNDGFRAGQGEEQQTVEEAQQTVEEESEEFEEMLEDIPPPKTDDDMDGFLIMMVCLIAGIALMAYTIDWEE